MNLEHTNCRERERKTLFGMGWFSAREIYSPRALNNDNDDEKNLEREARKENNERGRV